jgi:replicative DNA helicase
LRKEGVLFETQGQQLKSRDAAIAIKLDFSHRCAVATGASAHTTETKLVDSSLARIAPRPGCGIVAIHLTMISTACTRIRANVAVISQLASVFLTSA